MLSMVSGVEELKLSILKLVTKIKGAFEDGDSVAAHPC